MTPVRFEPLWFVDAVEADIILMEIPDSFTSAKR
jgi:hypothetical protein